MRQSAPARGLRRLPERGRFDGAGTEQPRRGWSGVAVLCRGRAHHGRARSPGNPHPAAGRARGLPHRRHRRGHVRLLRGDARGLGPVSGPRPAGRPRPGVRRPRFARVGLRPHARPLRRGRVLDRDAGGDRLLLLRDVRRRRELAQPAGDQPEPGEDALALHGDDVRGRRDRAAPAQRRGPGRLRSLRGGLDPGVSRPRSAPPRGAPGPAPPPSRSG